MEEDIKKVDAVIEILDARIPLSSRNPDLDKMARDKFRLIVLNKQDLADDAKTGDWIRYFKKAGISAIAVEGRVKSTKSAVEKAITEVCREKLDKMRAKGYLNPGIRAMIVGVPNTGKSTVINTLCQKASAKTGNTPGVTKSNQWLTVSKTLSVLDTPGILWPRFENETVGTHLAYFGSVNDDILNNQELAVNLIEELNREDPVILKKRYGITNCPGTSPVSVLEEIGIARNVMKKGGEVDYNRTSDLIINDLRSGKLGRITLERPEENG